MPLGFDAVVAHPLFDSDTEFVWRMGVRTLPPSEWLQPDDARDADLAQKEVLRTAIPDEVMAWLPAADGPSEEVLDLVRADLRTRAYPEPREGHHPIDTAARGIQEDLCLMERRGDQWILTAGSVCFPTRWSLPDKLGQSLAEIHQPVPRYREDLGSTVDRFFDRMAPGSLVWRLNWSVVGSADRRLHPADRQAPPLPPVDPGRDLHLRIERQTLRRLVDHTAICFGIRIHVWPLADVADTLQRRETATHLRSLPEEVAVYKNLEAIRAPLARWLEQDEGDGS